jgi:hypothetical protein
MGRANPPQLSFQEVANDSDYNFNPECAGPTLYD